MLKESLDFSPGSGLGSPRNKPDTPPGSVEHAGQNLIQRPEFLGRIQETLTKKGLQDKMEGFEDWARKNPRIVARGVQEIALATNVLVAEQRAAENLVTSYMNGEMDDTSRQNRTIH